jgi:hypothetical protein
MKALDVRILCGFAGLNVHQLNLLLNASVPSIFFQVDGTIEGSDSPVMLCISAMTASAPVCVRVFNECFCSSGPDSQKSNAGYDA